MGFIRSIFKRYDRLVFWLLFLVAGIFIVKWKILAGYAITTPSMEPTLIGNADSGDRLAVFKQHYTFLDPKRFDLAVFFKEGDFAGESGVFDRPGGMRFVKRLVGLPRETIQIKDGDLYLGSSPSKLVSKDLSLIRDMLIPVYRAKFNQAFFTDWEEYSQGRSDCFSLANDGLRCNATARGGALRAELLFTPKGGSIRDDYLTKDNRLVEGTHPINDLAIHFEVTFQKDEGHIFGELREAGDTFRFLLNSKAKGGGGSLAHQVGAKVSKDCIVPSNLFVGFVPGRTYEISFMNIDNQVFLLLNGLVVSRLSYEENSDLFSTTHHNAPLIGATETEVLFDKIRIDRDVHYVDDMGTFAVDRPYTVPEGHFFFLGDNSAKSEDSRFFGPIPREDLIGRPFMVFYPFDRIRFF